MTDSPVTDSTEQAMDAGRRRFLGNAGLPIAATALLPALLGLPSSAETHTGAAESEAAVLSAKTLADLRRQAVPTGVRLAAVAGHHRTGDGGGGLFFWDAAFLPDATAGIPDDGGTYLLPDGSAGQSAAGRWRRVYDGAVNPRWFGALGDDSGRTPQEDGLDISDAPWNRWPHWLTRSRANNPSYFGFSIGPTTPPFTSTDSWDWIGLQLALFSVGEHSGEVSIGGGVYQLTKPLFYSGGMRATLTGAGMYQTRLTKKRDCFDDSTVLYLYRIGGVPTLIRGLCFSGPAGGGTKNFTLITQNNTNGVHLESCWLAVCQTGVRYVNNSGDSFVTGCTAEYCETVLHIDLDTAHYPSIHDGGSEVTVAGCNFWQSASPAGYCGIRVAGGSLHCTGTRFVGFGDASIEAVIVTDHAGQKILPKLSVIGNQFLDFQCRGAALSGDGQAWVISGNRFVGGAGAFAAVIPDCSLFAGNYVESTNAHACLNINQGAQQTTVTGNTFVNSSGKATVGGGLVQSVKQGVNYSGGCSQCVITGNTCRSEAGPGTAGIQVDAHPASGNVVTGNIIT